MTTPIQWPTCPQPESFPLITGFVTPSSDLPPPPGLSGSISLDVTDPSENYERIRVVETDTAWELTVKWCICGPFAEYLTGCWCVQVSIDDIDGIGTTSGRLGSKRVDSSTAVIVPTNGGNDDTSRRCFTATFRFPAGRVTPGVYNLVVVITFSTTPCDKNPRKLANDILGYAVIPALVFYDEDAPFCPPPPG